MHDQKIHLLEIEALRQRALAELKDPPMRKFHVDTAEALEWAITTLKGAKTCKSGIQSVLPQ